MPTENTLDAHGFVFALYSYDGVEPGDLSFRAGDLLGVAKPPVKSDSWFQAMNPRTGCKGEVPANYVTAERGYSAALDVFHRMDRAAAEAMLTSDRYRDEFNYIIRPSTDNQALALSVRSPADKINHFKIHFIVREENCCIFEEKPFDTIEDLIIYYMENPIPKAGTLQAYKPFKNAPPKL